MLKLVSLLFVVLVVAEAVKLHPSKIKYARKRALTKRQAVTRCAENQFLCGSGECILADWACDTQADCEDGSDEKDCICTCRGEYKFRCNNGKCVSTAFVCDCGDGSDEVDCPDLDPNIFRDRMTLCGCVTPICQDEELGFKLCEDTATSMPPTCGSWHVQCDNHNCVEPTWVCDGDDDCGDNSDEKDCGGTCNAHMFHCHSGDRCVPSTYRCDIVQDCPDGSDETNCATLHPSSCKDHISIRDCALLNETTRPICIHDEYSFKFCRKFCNQCFS